MGFNNIRNFVIIAHIDHGKSTLADRFLEITGAVEKDKMQEQFLDSMDLEREKGITIKMHPVRLIYNKPQSQILNLKSQILQCNDSYILNLIDTPGHIDFTYEISRALACVEGALLLVDATQGIQAQTLFNLEQARKQNLKIIGAVNKIDMPYADVEQAVKELASILQVEEAEISLVSGKSGQNVEGLLQRMIKEVPAPKIEQDSCFKALIFDSKYDSFSGVVAFVRVFGGAIKTGDKIYLINQKREAIVKEVGYFFPKLTLVDALFAGEIGYIKTGIKEPVDVKVGETIIKVSDSGYLNEKPLIGYKEPQPVLYLSLYPSIADDFTLLKDALEKLKLNDPALSFQVETKMVLGRGVRIGFLGSLHAEIAMRRLKNEFGLDLIVSVPQTIFKVIDKKGKESIVSSPADWPDLSFIQEIQEPIARIEIVTPSAFLSRIFRILPDFDIILLETKNLTVAKTLLIAQAPLREIVTGSFYETIKSVSEGYGSFSFEQTGFQLADLVKIDILVAGEKQDPLAKIAPRKSAFFEARKLLQKLKGLLPPQQFAVALQAVVGGKVIARENLRSLRKDVLAPLYGGDITRKRKLLDIQKKGKKELKEKSRVNISAKVFFELFRS